MNIEQSEFENIEHGGGGNGLSYPPIPGLKHPTWDHLSTFREIYISPPPSPQHCEVEGDFGWPP